MCRQQLRPGLPRLIPSYFLACAPLLSPSAMGGSKSTACGILRAIVN